MTDKAYIVANEQQEREVFGILGANGLKYVIGTYSQFRPLTGFPYVIYESDNSNVLKTGRVPKIKYSTDIAFDGRKEEQMSNKYVVSQEFMNELEEWKINLKSYDDINNYFVGTGDLRNLPILANLWASDRHITNKEHNNRLIAILHWVNGEDVFEVEKPKKWVVRSKEHNNFGEYTYVTRDNLFSLAIIMGVKNATKFDTKEEAESWANAHQEVIEVEA